jgi:Sec-independent protein translocase protein TatA
MAPSLYFIYVFVFQFTILLVGYFVLGPSDLYKLVKEIGKFVQNFQTFTSEATASIENNLESQLQLNEIRKAQRELTDAFSFRRSINVDEDTEAFEVNAQSPRAEMPMEGVGAAAATAATMTNGQTTMDATATEQQQAKKKIRRRRVKKQPPPSTLVEGEDFTTPSSFATTTSMDTWGTGDLANNVPDLTVDDGWFDESQDAADKALREANEELRKEAMEAEAEERRKERIQRLQTSVSQQTSDQDDDAASARFAAQLTGNWNSQILDKGEELSPLANIMERLALLEDERKAADERLQEEFRLREENEERFYREKRKLLEEAAAQVQAKVYNLDGA